MDTEQSTEDQGAEQADQPQDQLPDDPSTDRDEGATHGGADTPADQAGKGDESNEGASTTKDDEYEKAKAEMKKLEEEGPPEKLEDWPDGPAKYETFGGPEGEHSYEEGPESQLGPDSLRHHEDGSVEVRGEEVEDSDEFKSDPIPGGPTDPNSPNQRSDNAQPEDASVNEGGDSEGEDSEEDEEN